MDKWATKLVAEALGIATAPGVLLTAAHRASVLRGRTRSWSSRSRPAPATASPWSREPASLPPALDAALALDDRVLVEDLVDGREIDVAVLGRPDGERIVAPALEIVVDGLFDHDDEVRRRAPTSGSRRRWTSAGRKALEDAAVAMFDALGCAGVARVDFFLTEDGPVLNEVNTMPGFTEAVAGAEDVRGRRAPTPHCWTCWSATCRGTPCRAGDGTDRRASTSSAGSRSAW